MEKQKISEYANDVLEGRVSWYAEYDDGLKEMLFKKNTVLNGARTIMRDLLANSGEGTIVKVQLGDRGITFQDNLNETPPTVFATETALTQVIGEIPVIEVERSEVSGRPSVIFTFKVNKDNSLGSTSGDAIIAECGLCRGDNVLFSKVAHKPIIKRPFVSLILQWEIIL